jgi:hypothetical protein
MNPSAILLASSGSSSDSSDESWSSPNGRMASPSPSAEPDLDRSDMVESAIGVVWVKRWKVLYKDRDIKSCLEGRDKTPSDSRRPVPGY